MASRKPTGGRSRRKPGPSAGDRITALLQGWQQRRQTNRRQRELRRIRQQRQRTDAPAAQQLSGMRRALQFRGLQRRMQRRQDDRQPKRSPIAWLWPRSGNILSSRAAAAQVLRNGATALLLTSLISLVIRALPLRLSSPNWYMEILGSIGETAPVLVIACVLSLLPLVLGNDDQETDTYRLQLVRRSRLGYILALLLLPLQLGFMSWLIGDAYATSRNQLNAIRSNANALIDGARQTSTTEQFVAFLRSRNLNANLESIAAAPLAQVRTEFVRTVRTQQQQGEANLKETTNTTLLRYGTNGARLFVSLAILAIFMRSYQVLVRRCSPSWSSNTEQASQAEEAAASQPN